MTSKKKKIVSTLLSCCFLCAALGTVMALQGLNVTVDAEKSTTIQNAGQDYALVLEDYQLVNGSELQKIIDPNGKEIEVLGNSFKPLTVGVYTLVYKTYTRILTVLYESKNMSFVFDGGFSGEYIAGEKVAFPRVNIADDYCNYEEYDVIVSLDGQEVRRILDVSNADNFGYRFHKAGIYEIKYACTDIFGQEFLSNPLEATVIDERIILFDAISETVQNFSTVTIGYPYGYYQGNLYDTDVFITYPNGKREKYVASTLKVNELGDYKIEYCSIINGTEKMIEQSFSVVEQTTAWFMPAGGIAQANVELPTYSKESGKAQLLTGNGDFKAEYFNIVDLSKLTKEDNVISFVPYSTANNYMSAVTVTLTDIYDSKNTLQIRWFDVPRWGIGNSYMTVVRNGTAYGISNESKTYMQTRLVYGSVAAGCSFRGATNGTSEIYNLQWDFENNRIYTYIRGQQWLVLDTDDDTVVPTKDKFYGFTTGEVYVSVQTSVNLGAGLYILDVGGQSLSGEKETLDYENNLILFDKPLTELPVGAVGYTYPIDLDASINAACTEKPEISFAIYKEGEELPIVQNVKEFVPETVGNYTMVWQTVYQGMILSKKLPFIVEQVPRHIVVDLPKNEKVVAGGEYNIPSIDISGGAGNYQVAYKVYNEDKEFERDAYGEYRLDTGKDVTVEIIVEDCIGYIQKFSYTIEIEVERTRLVLDYAVPRSARAGESMTLPDFQPINYASDVTLSKKIVVDESLVLTKAPFTFTVPEGEFLTVRYIGGEGTEYEEEIEYSLRIISATANSDDILNVYSNVNKTVFLENGLLVETNTSGRVLGMPYALPTGELYFKLSVNEEETRFEKLCVTFSDTVNLEKKLILTITNIADGFADLRVGSNLAGKISYLESVYSSDCGDSSYTGEKYYQFEFVFNSKAKTVETLDGVTISSFSTFENGTQFSGFVSNVAYVDFSLENVSGNASMILGGIGNQSFGYYLNLLELPDDDNMGPLIYANEPIADIEGVHGTMFTVPAVYARDVLQAESFLTVTVKNPDGEILYNKAILSSIPPFKLTQFGTYSIIYEATDKIGNVAKKTIAVNVLDNEKPVSNIAGSYCSEYKLGDKVTIQAATVTDNTTEGLELTIFVRDSYGRYEVVNMGDIVELKRCGKYEIIYRAMDKFRNVSLKVFEFTVNE